MQTETNTNESNQNETETVDVEIYYTKFLDDRDHEAFELTRDIRTYAQPKDVTGETFDLAYEQIHRGEVSLEDVVQPDKLNVVLGHIYSRMQGGRVDSELSYDGSKTRSMMIGGVIVIDGRASLVGEGTSFPDLGDLEYLRSEDVQENNE